MNRNQVKEFYPILQAYAEGRVIECRTKPSAIEDENVPNDWTEIKEIKFWKSCEESYNNRVDDPRLDSRPPYLWQWMDYHDILIGNKVYRKPSFKPFLHLLDSEIKKIINQFNRYKYEKESIASVRQETVV